MRTFNPKKKAIVLLLIGIVFLTYSFKSKFFEVAKQIEIYNSLFKELNMYYVDEINPAEFTNKAIKNTLKDLDPYTSFYTEQDVETARIRRAGEYGGIGVAVNYIEQGIQISEIYKDFSADKAGLKVGDIIISVDNQSIKNREIEALSMLLKGTPNSKLSIEVNRQGNIFRKDMFRDKVVINAVPFAEMIDENTGYIALTRFNEKASSEVKKAYRKLKKQGMTKLVFDLRYNPGGSLLESIRIFSYQKVVKL
jgi:carboxyl-terminal processing protease